MSVLIPAFNEQANIEATIRSLLASKHVPEQIIIIDDGSTDETSRIVIRLIEEVGTRLTLLQKMNEGSKARALSYALPFVNHGIIVCIDADTIIEPHALLYITEAFRDPHVGAVAGKVYPANTRALIERFQFLEYVQGQNLEKRVFSLGNAITVVPGALGAWRVKAIRELGGFPTDTIVEDQDTTLALLARNWRVVYDERATAFTETPTTVSGFFKQRFRWTFGTLQCFLKYEHWLGSRKNPALGFLVLPNMVLFNIILPLLVPLIDVSLILSLLMAPTAATKAMALLALLFFVSIDTLYLTEALRFEKFSWREYLLPLFLQRWFYRYMMAAAMMKSLYILFFKKPVLWGEHDRQGHAQRVWMLWSAENLRATASSPSTL
jgi:cellulose synthase/poly-beta-1,6-N-acetylglucosamine synthase-like glycosyltransferase